MEIADEAKWIFWEDFTPVSCKIVEHGNVDTFYKTISIWRDDNYKILFELKGTIPKNTRHHFETHIKSGEFIERDKIKVRGENFYIELEGLLIMNSTKNGLGDLVSTGEIINLKYQYLITPDNIIIGDFDQDFDCDVRILEPSDHLTHVNYWFLNGSEDIKFTTTRKSQFNSKVHLSYDDNDIQEIDLNSQTCYESICLRLNYNGKKFILSYVSPKITNCFSGTSLLFTKGNIPNDDELLCIQKAINFIFDVELIYIGYTKYNYSNSPIEKYLKSSLTESLKEICSFSSFPPIPITKLKAFDYQNTFSRVFPVESSISHVIQKFFELKDDFPLFQVVGLINSHKSQMLDIQIQPLATALELIQKSWFGSKFSECKGKYLEDKSYTNIIENYLIKLKSDMEAIPNHEIILNKIKGANQIGLTQRNPIFFQELKLEIGKVEENALKERNIVIHGSLKTRDYKLLSLSTTSFFTLLRRIVLRLFEVKIYVDYSAYGFPIKEIDVPLGGPQNEGQPN